jgi:hypothetical protein
MRNRKELLLQLVCGVLAVLVILQVPGAFSPGESLAELKPAVATPVAEEQAEPPAATQTNAPGPLPPGMMAPPPGMAMPTPMPGMPMMGMRPGMPGMPSGRPGKPVELPPKVKASVDFIVNSELLGPVPRPLPMALLGIAGKDVFFRAPNGQTGLLSEGGEMGGVKLLQIGTNRILIEHEGQKKELLLFSGYGGDSLMPTNQETPK